MSEIRKVVLYKHGVGYFEREAKVKGHAEVKLSFKAEEMNDVLKSLTVFDSAGGSVSSVSYDNQKPIKKLLEETSINIPSSGGQLVVLHNVRGASVMVAAGNRMIAGQVVGIDERTVPVGMAVANSIRLSILDEGGALHSFDVQEISSVRFLDEHLKSELKHLFETLLLATKRDTKNLKLFARGDGERTLSISYVVECPVWKTSYRIAIPEEDTEKPYLQGWALVDNPQDEDWSEVSLSLVSGLPISFTHDLYSPRYLKRRAIEVEREAAAGPVMTEAAMPVPAASMALDYGRDDDLFAESCLDLAEPATRMAVGQAPSRAQKLASAGQVETVTQAVGQLFEYRIEQPVTVLRNQSALVPIVGSHFEGGRKILYNARNRKENPFAVIDFKNTTGLTLEGGPLTVFEGDVYAGEAMLDTLSPDEDRLIPYAVDLSVDADVKHEPLSTVTMETFRGGLWTVRRAHCNKAVYRFHNKSDKAKELVLEHPIAPGELVDTAKPFLETRSYWRFSVSLPARTTTEFPVTVRAEEDHSTCMTNGDANWLLAAVLQHSPSRGRLKAFEEKVRAIAERMNDAAQKEQAARSRQHEIVTGQARLRENLSQLSQSHDEARLRSRYVDALDQQEDELAGLESELKALAARRRKIHQELAALIGELDFEQSFAEAGS
jgi:hypothetical protein